MKYAIKSLVDNKYYNGRSIPIKYESTWGMTRDRLFAKVLADYFGSEDGAYFTDNIDRLNDHFNVSIANMSLATEIPARMFFDILLMCEKLVIISEEGEEIDILSKIEFGTNRLGEY